MGTGCRVSVPRDERVLEIRCPRCAYTSHDFLTHRKCEDGKKTKSVYLAHDPVGRRLGLGSVRQFRSSGLRSFTGLRSVALLVGGWLAPRWLSWDSLSLPRQHAPWSRLAQADSMAMAGVSRARARLRDGIRPPRWVPLLIASHTASPDSKGAD